MSFSTSQTFYCDLRNIIAEKTQRLVIWVGSGFSAAAGLPTWSELRDRLVAQLRQKAHEIPSERCKLLRMAERAANESNYWLAFQLLQRSLGSTTYRSTIRDALRLAPVSTAPDAYRCVWKLQPAGVVNLNLDRLLTKALGSVAPDLLPVEFSGRSVQNYLHALKSPRPFIANLHGIADDVDSWVFTSDELKHLFESNGYHTFIDSCFATTTTLFLGLSADDVATGGHLRSLTQAGIDTGSHYWLTDRRDLDTDTWAEESGIKLIRYDSHDNHVEVAEFFEDILKFVSPEDFSAPPVALERPTQSTSELPTPHELLQWDAEAIRQVLNAHATGMLQGESSERHVAYGVFVATYDEAIYRAWYTSVVEPYNRLLDYTLHEEVARGAFGRVYRATAPDGRQVAIKVLLEDIRRDPDLLGSFRRGIRSMKYLRSGNVDGMVAYHDASEIPALVVMDWVDGPTLSEAMEARHIDDWASILKIAIEMTVVIRRAHGIAQRVLHRDIRPSNIMFDGFYSRPDSWRVVVLDFDLSWHIGAHEKSVVHGSSMTGYLAPEQLQLKAGASTRHAAVDSFGVGMTLYYLISGTNPLPTQHKHKDWDQVVTQAALRCTGTDWLSLPHRYARLVGRATEDEQAARWDIAQIHDELRRLQEAVLSEREVVSAELLAEEVAARCAGDYHYGWDDNSATAILRLASGLEVRTVGNDSERQVSVKFHWHSSGREDRKRVGKWMKRAVERCVALLRKQKWNVTTNVRLPLSAAIEATLSSQSVAASLPTLARGVAEVMGILSFE